MTNEELEVLWTKACDAEDWSVLSDAIGNCEGLAPFGDNKLGELINKGDKAEVNAYTLMTFSEDEELYTVYYEAEGQPSCVEVKSKKEAEKKAELFKSKGYAGVRIGEPEGFSEEVKTIADLAEGECFITKSKDGEWDNLTWYEVKSKNSDGSAVVEVTKYNWNDGKTQERTIPAKVEVKILDKSMFSEFNKDMLCNYPVGSIVWLDSRYVGDPDKSWKIIEIRENDKVAILENVANPESTCKQDIYSTGFVEVTTFSEDDKFDEGHFYICTSCDPECDPGVFKFESGKCIFEDGTEYDVSDVVEDTDEFQEVEGFSCNK